MVVIWDEQQHSLGIPDIDAQHQELFLITNRLAEEAERPPTAERQTAVIGQLKRLYAYCHYHFNTEEEILRCNGYDARAEHRGLHAAFTERVKSYLVEARGTRQFDLRPVLDELVNWILGHILDEDRKFAAWFAQRGRRVTAHPSYSGHGADAAAAALTLWNEKHLAMDIKGIDEQHRELVLVLQQANDLLKASPARQQAFLPVIIRKLFYYSQFHFSFEEELMARHGWPELMTHRGQHQEFIKRILDFHELGAARRQGVAGEIVGFLKDWTIHHILEEDRKFKTFLG